MAKLVTFVWLTCKKDVNRAIDGARGPRQAWGENRYPMPVWV
jgi:hypothetical protein